MSSSFERFGVTEGQLRALVAEGLRDGGDWCDLYFEDTSYHDLLLRDGVVGSGGYHVDYGCGIRVLKGEKTGYAYAERTDFPSLKAAARAAGAIAVSSGSGSAIATPLRGSQPPETSGCAGPLPLPSAAGPSLLRSCPEGKVPPNRGLRGFENKPACWLRFPEAAAVSTTPATADSAAPASLPSVVFWSQNWRKGGLQPRRIEIVREQCFYNQNWCGCEFSKRQTL